MDLIEDLIDTFYAIHSEDSEARRTALIKRAIAEDVEFYGLQVEAVGRQAFADVFRDGGTRLIRTSAVAHRGRWAWNTWELQDAEGEPVAAPDGQPYAGVQFSEIGPDGRLLRIVPFRGQAPPPLE